MISHRKNRFIPALTAFVLACAGISAASAQQDSRFPPIPEPQKSPESGAKMVAVAPAPYRAAQAPYRAAPAPYRAAPVPYRAVPVPYRAAPVPYRAAPVPYRAAPAPYRAAPAPYRAAPAPYRAAPAPNQAVPVPRGPAFAPGQARQVPPDEIARTVPNSPNIFPPPVPYGAGPVPRGPGFGPRGPGFGPRPYKKDDDDGPFSRFFDEGPGPRPSKWFKPGDPEEGLAEMWEDFIHIGSDYGEMPGGWYVPEIGVPNPVDVQEELRDAPGEFIDVLPDVVNINPPR